MTERTRNRIIGGVFLASLLVIIVPMFFDEPMKLDLDLNPPESADLDEFEPPILDVPDDRPIVEAEQTVKSVVNDGHLVDSGTRVGEPVLTYDADKASQWAVQLASFANLENAENLKSTVETDGHRAWISSAMVNENKVHRVIVGPYIKRGDAQETVTQFHDSYQVDPIVVGFSY
ncbi:MAG: SPOR domain-containing protein [Gammaproteobacteria bacterium]|nr:SPOR domain-containing protein [Gammaproteobacteria bacterium]